MSIVEVDKPSNVSGSYTYISMKRVVGGTVQDSGPQLCMRAPMHAVTIKETEDTTIHKALSGSLLVASFGPSPVMISIQGVDVYGLKRGDDKDNTSITKFYEDNNISTSNLVRLGITDAGTRSAKSYTCALVSLRRNVNGSLSSPGVGSYELKLLGVRE